MPQLVIDVGPQRRDSQGGAYQTNGIQGNGVFFVQMVNQALNPLRLGGWPVNRWPVQVVLLGHSEGIL